MININFQTIALFIGLIASIATGVYVILSNRKSFLHRSFMALVLGLSIWGACIALLYMTLSYKFFFATLIFMSGAVWFVGLLFFSYSFPSDIAPPKKFYLWLIPAAVIFILSPFKLFVSDFSIGADGYLQPINNMIFFIPFMGIFLSYVIYSIFLVFRNYYRYKNILRYKMQFFYFFSGLSIFIISIVIFDTVLPAMGIYRYNLLGPAMTTVFFGLTAYAIARHQLLDIRLVIQRGLIYLVLLSFIVAIYIGIFQLLGHFFGKMANIDSIISAGITMILGILFFRPIEEYFQRSTDRFFFKSNYNYADAIQRLSRILNTNLNQTEIISASSLSLKEIFKSSDAAFHLTDSSPPARVQPQEGSVSIPIIFENARLGTIELGPKLSGDSYNSRDIQLLETFAHQAAVALEKGRLFEEVEKYSTQLEELVTERTAEIKNLQQEQKHMMIDISHNLQTPLAVIRGELESLNEFSAEDGKMSAVSKSLARISSFISQLLHLSRLDSSSYSIDFSPIDLSALINEQVEYFEVMAKENKVQVISSISPNIQISGNKQLLEEMLTNLVANAIKYKKSGTDSMVNISLSESDSTIELAVEDNGIGISDRDLPKIFTNFYRSSHDAKSPQGAGLGLAIVKSIVLKHNGTISVSSKLGKGTEFVAIFPKP